MTISWIPSNLAYFHNFVFNARYGVPISGTTHTHDQRSLWSVDYVQVNSWDVPIIISQVPFKSFISPWPTPGGTVSAPCVPSLTSVLFYLCLCTPQHHRWSRNRTAASIGAAVGMGTVLFLEYLLWAFWQHMDLEKPLKRKKPPKKLYAVDWVYPWIPASLLFPLTMIVPNTVKA